MPTLEISGKVNWAFWDSFISDGALTTATFFTVPLGSAGKDRYQTNLSVAGQLPEGNHFDILGFSWGCPSDTTGALQIAFSKGVWRFIASEKAFQELPFFATPAGFGMQASQSASLEVVSNGLPDSHNILAQDIKIGLEPGEPFRVEATWPVAVAASKMWFFLWGQLTRNVN